MGAPVACPKCSKPTAKRRSVDKNIWHWCATCRKDWKAEYIAACNKCTDLQVVMYSMTHVAIQPRRGTADSHLIKTLFDKKDRNYVWMRGWMVTNLDKYAHLKCIQVALAAYLTQVPLPEAA